MMFRRRLPAFLRAALAALVLFAAAVPAGADDWPQWGGPSRTGIWAETGILERFPEGGLKVQWRIPVRSGYAGPAVAGGRVILLDWALNPDTHRLEGKERALCLEETTGKTLWTREWDADYSALMASYATGPRATPSIDEGRVYVLGSTGIIHCLKMENGEPVWSRNAPKDWSASIPTWGSSCSPLIDGGLVIFVIGAEPNGGVIALDKLTGEERWRALPADGETGYSQPLIIEAAGKRQLIVWRPKAVSSIDPATGAVYWEVPFNVPYAMAIAQPVRSGDRLFVSNFYGGSMMMELDNAVPAAREVWRIKGKSEKPEETQGLHAVMTTPLILGDFIYGTCSYGELRCLEAKTGRRVWEDKTMTRQGRWGSAFMVKNGDRWFVNNDQGELLIAQFTPEKFVELGRTPLIKPDTSSGFGPRKFYDSIVNWVYPAYANRCLITRNDSEAIRVSLAAE